MIKKLLNKLVDKYLFKNTKNVRFNFIKNWLLDLKPNSKILDAGAGLMRYKSFCTHLNYHSQDFGGYTGGETFEGVRTKEWRSKECDLICDITSLPVADSTYDFILCSDVFEHLPNPEAALKELSRVLKKGGDILVTSPFRCFYHQPPFFFFSGFSKYWFERISDSENLKIKKIIQNGNFYNDVAYDILRISNFSPRYLSLLSSSISLIIIIYLKFMEFFYKNKAPESCNGYFILMSKY